MTSKPNFTRGEGSIYGLISQRSGGGERDRHARALQHGLDLLGPSYVCEVCAVCHGLTNNRHDPIYGCRYCEGTGLTQGFGCSATVSQRHQVLIAASRSMLLDFEVEIL